MVDIKEKGMSCSLQTANGRSWLGLSACLALAACAGCARQVPVYPVEGHVLAAGKPVARAQVAFHPINGPPDAARPVGQTDEQGRFTLTTQVGGDGAPAGEYRVAVTRYLARKRGKDDYEPVNDLPARYESAESSGLTATIGPGDNRLPPFELKRP
jgi:hypothetical protein